MPVPPGWLSLELRRRSEFLGAAGMQDSAAGRRRCSSSKLPWTMVIRCRSKRNNRRVPGGPYGVHT